MENRQDESAVRGAPDAGRRMLFGAGGATALLAGMALAAAGPLQAAPKPGTPAPGVPAPEVPAPEVPAYEQIRNLLAMYSFLLDSADYPKWGALFGDTGTLELNGEVWARGSAGIAKKMSEVMAATPVPVTGFTGNHMYRHIFTNAHIELDEAAGTAEARSYFFVLHVFKDQAPVIRGGGRYRDGFARGKDGLWHFTAKRMDFDWSDA